MKYRNILLGLLAVGTLPSLTLAKSEGEKKGGKGFGKFDTNGDEVITLDEAESANAKKLVEHFTEIDADGNGEITKEEMREHHKKRMDEHKAKAKAMDTDGNGTISKDEAEKAGAKKLVEHFEEIDGNGDGEIDREEMKKMRGMMREKKKDKSEE